MFGALNRRELFLFACSARIDAVRDQPAHLLGFVARLLQADVWIDTERDALLLAGEAILEAPPAAPRRRDLEIQAAAVEQTHGLPSGRRILDFRGREQHGGNSQKRMVILTSCPQNCPRKYRPVNGRTPPPKDAHRFQRLF
jgi:hypothetical protein